MDNQLLIPTNGLTGDVSSCTTSGIVVANAERTSLFFSKNISYITNNCTGESEKLYSWQPTIYFDVPAFAIAAVVVLGVMSVLGRK